MVSEIDLFNLENPRSAIRRMIESNAQVDITKFCPARVSVPEGYITKELRIKTGESQEISSLIATEANLFVDNGYPDNIYTPLYEAILNAFQHGNKNDPSKLVRLSYILNPDHLDMLVEDEGGVIDSTFIPFVLRHREIDVSKQFINFYKFANKEKPKTNNGTGTSFMHLYMSEVNYYLGEHGLMVHMVKNRF